MHKKATNKNEMQTKLPMYYLNRGKEKEKDMYENSKDGWTVGERVELRHAHEAKKDAKSGDVKNTQEKKGQAKEGVEARNHSSHSSLSAKQSSPQVEVIAKPDPPAKKEQPKRVNVSFYLNKMPSQPYGEYIDKMHETWYSNYQKLQRDHSFIQWIFPNSFQSRFNSHAKPLTSQEAQEFRTNPEIIGRYLKSYDMMLAFYGMRLKDKHTGELMRSRHPCYKERFYKTLIISWHNHMRITRILCSLTQTGFGRYASELCKFLKFQIYHPNGEMNQLKKYNIYKDWQPFEQYSDKPGKVNQYLLRINKRKEDNHQPPLKKQDAHHLTVPEEGPEKEERSKSLEKSPARRNN